MLPYPFPPLSWPWQYLMEGSYNKVFLAKGNIPAESYTFFIDILLDTIRYVCGCWVPRIPSLALSPDATLPNSWDLMTWCFSKWIFFSCF